MDVHAFFDPATWTLTYVVVDPTSRDAVVIDSVLDFDPATGRVGHTSIDGLLAWVAERQLTVRATLETHAHADHWSGAATLRDRLGIPVVIGAGIRRVQATFAPVFGLADTLPTDGSQFDVLAEDGQVLRFGTIEVTALSTPGHTPACVTWKIGDALFTGDALFMPDSGVGRCDFPGGSAETLYDAIVGKLYALPEPTRVFVGHDYQPGGRALAYETTIGASKAGNVQLPASRSRDEFVAARVARDRTLAPPRLLFYSIQVNLAAGRLPAPTADGRRFLVQPLTVVE